MLNMEYTTVFCRGSHPYLVISLPDDLDDNYKGLGQVGDAPLQKYHCLYWGHRLHDLRLVCLVTFTFYETKGGSQCLSLKRFQAAIKKI